MNSSWKSDRLTKTAASLFFGGGKHIDHEWLHARCVPEIRGFREAIGVFEGAITVCHPIAVAVVRPRIGVFK